MANHRTQLITTSEPVRITPNGLHSGMDITIQNLSETNDVYVGGNASMDTETDFGHLIYPTASFGIELPPNDAIYLMSKNGNARVAIFEAGLED